MNKTTFTSKTTIENIVNSLEAFKSIVYNVNYVNKLLIQLKNNILIAGEYASILHPILLNNFNLSENVFIVINVPKNMSTYGEGKVYYDSEFLNFSNKKLTNSSDFVNPNYNYDYTKKGIEGLSDYLNIMLNKNPSNKIFYRFYLADWTSGVQLCLTCIQPDILDNTKWIEVTSVVNLRNYFKEVTNITTIKNLSLQNPEYINFVNIISQIIFDLELSDWNISDLIQNIWDYSNISNINNTVCLYSKKYPQWNGKQVVDCIIPNSNINVQKMVTTLLNDIFLYYPSLSFGEIAFSISNINGDNILNICKIDTYNNINCIKEVKINLEKFFIKNGVIGDTIFNGNINIKDNNNNSVVQLDNVTKNISVHGKNGINQELHEIKGLLDIDNLSNENILTIVDKIADLNNTSYNVFNEVNDSILNNDTFTISSGYMNDVAIFKARILNKIEEKDIVFLYKPSNIFKTSKFSNESFLKIQTIVNEINKMSYEMYLFYVEERKMLTLSFVELLNDTEFYYLCSLKTLFRDNHVYFVMSYRLVQKKMIDNSYKTTLQKLIDSFSSLNRLLNYGILVADIPDIYNKLIEGDSVNSFTKYIQESQYSNRFGMKKPPLLFCVEYSSENTLDQNTLDQNSIGRFLFNEQYTEWNSKYVKDLIMPNTDRKVMEIALNVFSYYQHKYGLYKNSQNFIIHYLFDNGEKIAFFNKIMINGKEYGIGVGINLEDFIDLNILSIGDNKIGGNLYIQDENKSNIFCVDTEYNKIVNMYKTGFGTDEPKTIIDVNDSGLTDLINIIKDMAVKEHVLNLNINFIKNLDTIDASSVDNCINTNFINPNSELGSQYEQTKDDYFYCHTSMINDNPADIYNIYTWLYRNWDNTIFINTNDNNNKILINNYINDALMEYKNEYFFENSNTFFTSEWTFGKKFRVHRTIKNNADGKLYLFGNGVNIGNYDLKINNNGNISAFFDYMKYMNLYLQHFLIRYNTIDTTEIQNYKSVNDYFSIISNVVSPKRFTLKKIVVDFTNFKNTRVYDIDFNTMVISGNDLNQTIYEKQDINERNRYLLMLINIKSIYSKNNDNLQLFSKGDYGIINSEDDYVDFVSLFYCSDATTSSVTLISIDLQINTIILPSVDIKGDLRIKGDTYFHNDKTNTDFVSIDTDHSFIGIGTNNRYVNYSNNYITTTNNDLSRHQLIVSGSNFPISVHERTGEIKPERDSNNVIINYPNDKLVLFSNRTAVTTRRNSNYYNINEMNEYSKKYFEIAVDGPNNGKQIQYRYGADINFEIKDSTTITREIGNIHMVIDNIVDNNIKAGFGVSVVDTSSTGLVVEREILYVNNEGIMDIDKINLGVDVDKINNVSLSAKSNTLMINNTSLETIINNEIQKMFSVDTNGNLNIKYNGSVYVCQPK